MLLLTDKLNLKCSILYETEELLTITKKYLTLILISISPLVLMSYSLNSHGGYVESDIYLLQLLCHMTSDVKFLHIYLFFV